MWGYLKSLVYANKPQTIDALEINIERAIGDIRADLCEKVCKNWAHRMQILKASRGAHMKEILFKM